MTIYAHLGESFYTENNKVNTYSEPRKCIDRPHLSFLPCVCLFGPYQFVHQIQFCLPFNLLPNIYDTYRITWLIRGFLHNGHRHSRLWRHSKCTCVSEITYNISYFRCCTPSSNLRSFLAGLANWYHRCRFNWLQHPQHPAPLPQPEYWREATN